MHRQYYTEQTALDTRLSEKRYKVVASQNSICEALIDMQEFFGLKGVCGQKTYKSTCLNKGNITTNMKAIKIGSKSCNVYKILICFVICGFIIF